MVIPRYGRTLRLGPRTESSPLLCPRCQRAPCEFLEGGTTQTASTLRQRGVTRCHYHLTLRTSRFVRGATPLVKQERIGAAVAPPSPRRTSTAPRTQAGCADQTSSRASCATKKTAP